MNQFEDQTRFKKGDWVKLLMFENKVGWIHGINRTGVAIYTPLDEDIHFAGFDDITEADFYIEEVQNDFLIDLALATDDKKWFKELTRKVEA